MLDVTLVLSEGRGELLALQGSSRLARYKVPEPVGMVCALAPGFLLAAATSRPLLYVWSLAQESPLQKYVLPGLASALTSSPCGKYLAVGVDSSLRLWHLPSGQHVACLGGHYQRVTRLQWSRDGALLISGSEDSTVNVWQVGKVLGGSPSTPLHSLTGHSLPITDLHLGLGGPRARLFSAGLDSTCQVWELATGRRLLTLHFPAPLSALLVDRAETFVVGVSLSTHLYRVSLTEDGDEKELQPFLTAPAMITSCCLVDTDQAVLVGTATGQLLKFSTATGQALALGHRSGSGAPLDELVSLRLPHFPRSDKAIPFPFSRPLERAVTGVRDESEVILAAPAPTLSLPSDTQFLALARAASEEGGDRLATAEEQIKQLSGLGEELIRFATDHLLAKGS